MASKKKKSKKAPTQKSSSGSRSKKNLPGLIGVIHLPALPGAPGASHLDAASALSRAGEWAIREAIALEKAGFEAIIVENFGDAPFYKSRVPAETVAAMGIIAAAVSEAVAIPVGVNVLRNAGGDALAIAAVAGCEFVRVNVLSGVAATDQGIVESEAATLLRERDRLRSPVAFFADVLVKHAKSLSVSDVELAIEEVGLRSGADAVILTGPTTGRAVDIERFERAWKAARLNGIALYLGSGVTVENLAKWRGKVTGVIVGSALRQGGAAGQPLDSKRVAAFVKAYRQEKKKKK